MTDMFISNVPIDFPFSIHSKELKCSKDSLRMNYRLYLLINSQIPMSSLFVDILEDTRPAEK